MKIAASIIVEYMRCVDILEPYTMDKTFSAITEIIKIFTNLVGIVLRTHNSMLRRRKLSSVSLFT